MANRDAKDHYLRLILIAGIVILADQISKAVIWRFIPLYHSIPVIPGFFDLTHVHNPGGAFGFFADGSAGWRQFFFVILTSVAIITILYLYRIIPRTHGWLAAGLALIFGGAIGNLIDRIRFGEVVDFLKFYIGKYQWPSFNIADSAITVGVGIFIVHLVFSRMPDEWS